MDDIMTVLVEKINTRQRESMSYDYWIRKYVNVGLADQYNIIEYPDLVELIISDSNGKVIKRKLEDFKVAFKLTREHPNIYDFKRIDIEKLKSEHKRQSLMISNGQSFSNLRKKIIYYLSFFLIFPLFSKNVRQEMKTFIDTNINVITVITSIIGIILASYMIYLML